MLIAANLFLIFAFAIAVGHRRSFFWKILALCAIGGVFSLTRTRIQLSLPFADAVIMPHALLPFVLLLSLSLLRSRIQSGGLVYWIFLVTALSATLVNLFTLGSGIQVDWALFGALTFLSPSLFYFFAAQLGAVEKRLMLDFIASAVAISVVTGLPLYFFDVPVFSDSIDVAGSGYRINTILGNPLTQAGLCLMVLPWLAKRLTETRDTWSAFLLVLVLLGILLSGSRLIIPIALLFLGMSLSKSVATISRSGLAAGVLTIAGLIAFATVARSVPQLWLPVERIVSSNNDTIGSSFARFESLTTGLQLVVDEPVFGGGPGQVYVWSRAQNGQTGDSNVMMIEQGLTLVEPHSLPMIVAVEYGVLTLVMFGVLMLSIIRRFPSSSFMMSRARGSAPVVGVFLFIVQAVGSSDIAIMPHIATIFWLWCGCCAVSQRERTASRDGHGIIVSIEGRVKRLSPIVHGWMQNHSSRDPV